MKALKASKEKEIMPLGGTKFLVFASVVAGLTFAALPAEAARSGKGAAKPAQETVTTVAVKDPETTSSISSGDDDANCASSRRRLFVEGEGWIVRRVTTCY